MRPQRRSPSASFHFPPAQPLASTLLATLTNRQNLLFCPGTFLRAVLSTYKTGYPPVFEFKPSANPLFTDTSTLFKTRLLQLPCFQRFADSLKNNGGWGYILDLPKKGTRKGGPKRKEAARLWCLTASRGVSSKWLVTR